MPARTGAPLQTSAVHVGRQPIYDETGRLYGYELLFRDAAGSTAADGNGDAATTRTILAAFTAFAEIEGDCLRIGGKYRHGHDNRQDDERRRPRPDPFRNF